MCGIAGIHCCTQRIENSVLSAMSASLIARGPDDEGRLLYGGVGLLHRRLSIIDLAGGRQPILNEKKTLALVCNGEVYNFRELRVELEGLGHRFSTASDSEVILHLYEEWGEKALTRLNGMFAFVIADLKLGCLFLARDRFGQKPLFYAQSEDRLAFASGPRALAALDWVDTRVSAEAIHHYLEYQYIPAPLALYQGVRKLLPGHYAEWNGRVLNIQPYWQPALEATFTGSYQDAVEAVREKVTRAVSLQLVSDVPLGGFLSGGMDSSIVAALASQRAGSAFDTFAIGFPEAKYDERTFAQAVSRHLGTNHHELEVNPRDFSHFARVVTSCEEPFADASVLPTSILSRFARDSVTVALSGDGADELFGGYLRYPLMQNLQLLRHVPLSLRRAVQGILLRVLPGKIEERTFWGKIRRLVELVDLDGIERYLALITRFPLPLRHRLYLDSMRESVSGVDSLEQLSTHFRSHEHLMDGVMELDLKTYLPNDILVKVDRASMACGLEVRSPFLDHEVAELAFSLPASFKIKRGSRKRVLRDAFASLLPPEVFSRPKMGFGLPVARWLRSEWGAPARELLLEGRVLPQFFQRKQLEWMLREHASLRADYSYAIFALMVLEVSMGDYPASLR